MGNDEKLDVVCKGGTTVVDGLGRVAVVVDASVVAIVIVLCVGSTNTKVGFDSDEKVVVVEEGIGGDAFDGCIVGVATLVSLM